MKKSEMLHTLKEKAAIAKSASLTQYESSLIEQLLGWVQELGMEPPETEVLVKRDFGHGLDVHFVVKKRVWGEES